MTVTVYPWIAIVLGAILWAVPWPPKASKLSEAGKIIFAVGVLWLVGGVHGPGLTFR